MKRKFLLVVDDEGRSLINEPEETYDQIENLLDDYFKDFLSKIGYKNLEFQRFFHDGKPIYFYQKELELKHRIKMYLHNNPVSFFEVLHSAFDIFSKYFILDVDKSVSLFEYFRINNISNFTYFNDDSFCLAQEFYRTIEKNIIEPRFIIMNNIVSDGDFLKKTN